MSYDPRLGAGAYRATDADRDGDARKGSVRAARERMQAAQKRTQLPDTSKIIGLPRRPNQLISPYSQNKSAPAPLRLVPDTRSEVEPNSPSPQWPLPSTRSERVDPTPDIPPRSPKRLQRPREEPRPLSEDFPIQQLSPDTASPRSPASPNPNELLSPGSIYSSSRPITTSSIASESSIGSIPDFPVPQPPMPSIQQTRRFPSIGPPPSARRGPSSYYTQMSYVSPIVEESESHSTAIQSQRGSFASSNVFPINGDAFYPDDDLFSEDEGTIDSNMDTISATEHDDQRGLVQQSPALVRQASLGRRTKPSLMTIRSVDSSGDKKTAPSKTAGFGPGAAGLAAAALAAREGSPSGMPRSSLSREASSGSDSISQSSRDRATASRIASPLQQELRPVALADRAGVRRPPRLDMNAVRDAEARGSLTSLPDLIRRATRLASNLDRGRTASRLGMDFWESGAPDRNNARQSGLSEMLAAFPPPGQETPNRSGYGTPSMSNGSNSQWPSVRNSDNGFVNTAVQNEKPPPRRRRCCGMPLWLFITLLIILLIIIAAAVIIPVFLVVIPNQNKAATSTAAPDMQGINNGNSDPANNGGPAIPAPTSGAGDKKCSGVITCQNGGVAILNADLSCSCICINGFTGRTCTNNDGTGCTTTNIVGTANNATTGSGIPRLIEEATTNYKIPLNATLILSLFSSLSLSCAAENALITFNGLASRSVANGLHLFDLRSTFHSSRTLSGLHHPHLAQIPDQLVKRQTVGQTKENEGSSNQNSGGAKALVTQPISSNVDALDLGRIAVLLVLQETRSLDDAANAQESIQTLLTDNRSGNTKTSDIDLGPFTLDFVDFTIKFQNGTTIGAKPPSTSTS